MAEALIQGTAQHFIECATCTEYSEFFCNTCNQKMCHQCRETHLKDKKKANHNVVPYRDRGKMHKLDKIRDEVGKQFDKIKGGIQQLFTVKKKQIIESERATHPSRKENFNGTLKNCDFNFEQFKTIVLSNIKIITHLSIKSTEPIWASDEKGSLFNFDLNGNLLHTIYTCESKTGYHTVSKQGDLLYTERYNKTIYKVTYNGRKISPRPFLTTEEWLPWCIHSSTIHEGILLGMKKDKEWKISKFDKEGKMLRDFHWDAGGTKLYQSISYVTENINGDICSSDYLAGRVVVVNKFGEHQFSYSGYNSEGVYTPYGICSDEQGHIFVCGSVSCGQVSHEVHILAQDGQFLSFLPLPGDCPRAICVDNQQRIYVATERSIITVYKYTKNTDN